MKIYNCPNCGAPIEGERCQYCGTVIYDFAALQIGAPSYVKIRHENRLFLFRLVVDNFSMNLNPEYMDVTGALGETLHTILTGHSLDVSLEAHGVQMDNGALMTVIIEEGALK